MFGQATYLVLFLLVAGTLSVPVPLSLHFNTGVSGKGSATGGTQLIAVRDKGAMYNYAVDSELGAKANGEAHVEGYAENQGKVYGGTADVNGKVGGKVLDGVKGTVGVDTNGNVALGAINRVVTSGKASGGGGLEIGAEQGAIIKNKIHSVWADSDEDY